MFNFITQSLDKTETVYKIHNGKIQYKCNICGDYKFRGSILVEEDYAICHCFNCEGSGGISYYTYLNETGYSDLAKEYLHKINKNKIHSKKQNIIDKDIFKEETVEVTPEPKEDTLDLTKDGLPSVEFEMMIYTYNRDEVIDNEVYELKELPEEALIYLKEERCLESEDISDFLFVEETNDIIVPFWSDKANNKVYGIQSRKLHDKVFHNQFFNSFDYPSFKFYNLEYILSLPKGSDIYIFESVFDFLSCGIKNGGAVIGKTMSKEVQELLSGYNKIYCLDNDDAGSNSALKLAYEGNSVLVHDKAEIGDIKDYNELKNLGATKEDINSYIKENIRKPKRAIIELQKQGYKLQNKRKF